MNYTKNYHLPQWDETDRIMRTDFNQMCADMENGLLKTARDAAEAVSGASTGAASAAEAARRAQSSADSAMEKASAAFAVDNRPYVWGSFTGTGREHEISLGFRPHFMIIWSSGIKDTSMGNSFLSITQGTSNERFLTITENGFLLRDNTANAGINMSGALFYYVAFR